MEIWRLQPDGGAPEQLTDDELNNWFPHVSPDGQFIVFLSYGPDVDPGDHPFYKEVYLRLMPAGGGEPRVIAYLYGGQGTINVPSWAPDSRRLAFVSNSDRILKLDLLPLLGAGRSLPSCHDLLGPNCIGEIRLRRDTLVDTFEQVEDRVGEGVLVADDVSRWPP